MNHRLPVAVLFLTSFILAHSATTTSGDSTSTRAAFLHLIDRPRVPLKPEVRTLSETNGTAKSHFTFASDTEQRVPGILLKPIQSAGRSPAVIVLHGTGGNKDSDSLRPYLEAFVNAGCVAVAIDGRYHGERTKTGSGASEYNDANFRAYRTGKEHPFYYDTVWDVIRLIDYLETRDDVDPGRIGLIGFSKGGIETYLAAAADPRIAVAVPCIGVQSFRWGLENGQWKARVATIQDAFDGAVKDAGVKPANTEFVRRFYDRVVPGIYEQFDGPAMLPLIAPRPLLVINGDSDANTPLAGVRLAAEAARLAYRMARADEKFVLRIQENTGHALTAESRDAAVEWLVRWLRN
ncbi:MAG: alpha/beta fold hydrolase [Verrucomicrobiota bacterium]